VDKGFSQSAEATQATGKSYSRTPSGEGGHFHWGYLGYFLTFGGGGGDHKLMERIKYPSSHTKIGSLPDITYAYLIGYVFLNESERTDGQTKRTNYKTPCF